MYTYIVERPAGLPSSATPNLAYYLESAPFLNTLNLLGLGSLVVSFRDQSQGNGGRFRITNRFGPGVTAAGGRMLAKDGCLVALSSCCCIHSSKALAETRVRRPTLKCGGPRPWSHSLYKNARHMPIFAQACSTEYASCLSGTSRPCSAIRQDGSRCAAGMGRWLS